MRLTNPSTIIQVLQPNDLCGDAQSHLSSVILNTNSLRTITLTVEPQRNVNVKRCSLLKIRESFEQAKVFRNMEDLLCPFQDSRLFGTTVSLLRIHPVNVAGCSLWGAARKQFNIRSLRKNNRPPVIPVRRNEND